jgi:hypothetical protein
LNNPLIYTDPSGENPLLIAGIFLFLISTDPGYEIQKYLSPFAFKVDYNFEHMKINLVLISHMAHKNYFLCYQKITVKHITGSISVVIIRVGKLERGKKHLIFGYIMRVKRNILPESFHKQLDFANMGSLRFLV